MSERNIGLGGTEVQINIPVFITNGELHTVADKT